MNREQTRTPQQEFGAYLRERREGRSVSLEDVARVTKIPSRSLERLEAGSFESLPADVFVRGFVKSYASCVGLDPEELVQRYVDARSPKKERGERTVSRVDVLPRPPAQSASASREAGNPLARAGDFLARSLMDRGEQEPGSRKGTVTLAVIILVIVATLTMSYLLRRPSHSGDGVTRADTPEKLLA